MLHADLHTGRSDRDSRRPMQGGSLGSKFTCKKGISSPGMFTGLHTGRYRFTPPTH